MSKKSEADSGGTEVAVRDQTFLVARSSLNVVFTLGVACGFLTLTVILNLMLLIFL